MKIILTNLFLVLYTVFSAQTICISEVTAIESKASSYLKNEENIKKITDQIPNLEIQWKNKISTLRDELSALYKDRDNLIADMKVGARCSQCNGWKSDFEKKGESFEKHLGDVKGYAIPATTNEIEATRKSFSEQIAIKKVQLQNLEKGDKEILKQYNEIEKLKKKNENLCVEITQHSKNYETKVLNDAKTKHDLWLDDVLVSGTKSFVEHTRIKLTIPKIKWAEKEFAERNAEENNKIKENINAKQDKIKTDILENEKKISTLNIDKKQQVETLESELNNLFQEIKTVELKIREEKDERVLIELNERKDALAKKVITQKEKITEYLVKSKQEIENLVEANKKLSAENFQLNTDLPKLQAQKTAELKSELDKKLAAFKQLETETQIAYKQYSLSFDEKLKEKQGKQNSLVKEITSENNRMLTAVKNINCPVYNETQGKVNLNWNKLLPCVNIFASPNTLKIQQVVDGSSCSTAKFYTNTLGLFRSFFEALPKEERDFLMK